MQVRDLLADKRDGTRNLEVQNTRNSGTNVPDAQQIEVSCTQDVLDVMDRGQTNRATADTKMNEVRARAAHPVLAAARCMLVR
jgi:kinesin family member C2/C3